MKQSRFFGVAIAAGSLFVAAPASALGVHITEWMYNGAAEFVEFTNLSGAAVDFTGWSYDDDSALPGVFSLSGFGLVGDGESVVITEDTEANFRLSWALPAGVKVLGGYTNNLGRADQINLFDATNTLADRLSYGDVAFPGTIRTQDISGRPLSSAALGANDPHQWEFSTAGNADGAYFSLAGELGSPGSYVVPVPAAVWLMSPAIVALLGRRRRAS